MPSESRLLAPSHCCQANLFRRGEEAAAGDAVIWFGVCRSEKKKEAVQFRLNLDFYLSSPKVEKRGS